MPDNMILMQGHRISRYPVIAYQIICTGIPQTQRGQQGRIGTLRRWLTTPPICPPKSCTAPVVARGLSRSGTPFTL
ncbi:hypothetical protein ECSTECEH250_0762 [Escherichia coli STEC_EH250]|nr:hypothetical protein ECSTECEH250_0762 [Escherichia coli STEC_EH250]